MYIALGTLQMKSTNGYKSFWYNFLWSTIDICLPVNATSTFLSVVLFIAKACSRLFAAQVWKHELARSKSYVFLILRVRSYPPSGVTRNYLISHTLTRLFEVTILKEQFGMACFSPLNDHS